MTLFKLHTSAFSAFVSFFFLPVSGDSVCVPVTKVRGSIPAAIAAATAAASSFVFPAPVLI